MDSENNSGTTSSNLGRAGSIEIKTRFRNEDLDRLAVPVEVRKEDLSIVAHSRAGQVVHGLEPDRRYFVTARLPGGQTLTGQARIPAGGDVPVPVELVPDADQLPSEEDEVAHFLGNPAATVLPSAPASQPVWTVPAAEVREPNTDLPTVAGSGMLESLGADPVASPPVADPVVDSLLDEYRLLQSPSEFPPAAESVDRIMPSGKEFLPDSAGCAGEIQVRCFRGNALAFTAEPQPVAPLDVRPVGGSEFELSIPPAAGLWFLQIMQPARPAVNVALPISPMNGCTARLTCVPAGSAIGQHGDAVALDVHMADIEADALLRFRASGLTTQESVHAAEELISGAGRDPVAQDPVAVAVGCYALLSFNRTERLDEVSERLCNLSWMPDGAAIRGEYLARKGRHREAVAAFLSLLERGLPLFNEGLSFALERLALYIRGGDTRLLNKARASLELVEKYCRVTDFTKLLMRFPGLSPNTPGGELVQPSLSDPDVDGAAPSVDTTRISLTFGGGMQAPAAGTVTPTSVPAESGAPTADATPRLGSVEPGSEVIDAAAARFEGRAQQRGLTEQKIADIRTYGRSLLTVDDPQHVALRAQRVLAQPVVREALGAATAEHALESLGTVRDDSVLERIIGGSNLLGIAFLELGTTVARSVGRIHVRNRFQSVGFGTGVLVSPSVLLTNHHVLPDAESARSSLVEFNFQNAIDGRPIPSSLFDLEPDVLFHADAALDFAVVAVAARSQPDASSGSTPLARFGFNRINCEQGMLVLGESINVIQHPEGQPKQIALQQNELVDRLDDFLHYRSDTARGSSGSPLYNNQWEVVGLHHCGVPARDAHGETSTPIEWVANEGIRISSILDRLRKVMGTMTTEQQALLGDVLNPPLEVALPDATPAPDPVPELSVTSRPRPVADVPAETGTGAAPPAAESALSGSVSLTVPLHITVQLGIPGDRSGPG